MSAVHIAIARLALEKSVHIYCSSSAFLSGSHRQFRGNRKNKLVLLSRSRESIHSWL